MGKWGGPRAGSGRWSKAELEAIAAGAKDEDIAAMRGRTIDAVRRKRDALNGNAPALAPRKKKPPTVPAEAKAAATRPMTAQAMLEAIARSNADAAKRKVATAQELNPYQLPAFPPGAVPKDTKLRLAMDENTTWGNQQWAGAVLNGVSAQGLLFMGYPFLAELTQRPEYRVISETIADDATRKFIDFEVTGDEDENADGEDLPGGAKRPRDPETGAPLDRDDPDERKKKIKDKGKTDKVKALKDELARLEARDRFYGTARDDGFFGRSHIYLDFGIPLDGSTNPELRTPIGDGRDAISRAKVGKNSLKRLQPVEAMWAYPMAYNASQPLREDWYDPEFWYVMANEVHKSRMPAFVGHPVPSILKPSYAFGGLSLTQMAMPYVNIWLQTRESVGALIHSFSVMVLMTDMQSLLQPSAGAPDLMTRVNLFNAYRDNQGAFVLNKATEDFKNVSASLAGLHELQAQAQEHMASVSRIPLVKLTGISPSGLNASSEGEIRAYYDTIAAYQNRFFRPNLARIINFIQLSLWGEIDPEITFEFEPLWELSQKEKSEKEKDDADRDSKYVDMGAFSPGEIRKIKIDDPTLPYTGLDPDDVPDLEQEEEQGLEPESGRPQPIIGQGQGEGEPPEGAKGEDEQLPATPRAKTGLPWGDQFEWMRGYQLPARRGNGDAVVRTPLSGSEAATKGLRVGSRVRYTARDGSDGIGRIFGFTAGADGAVCVGVLDTDNDTALFLTERSVSMRPTMEADPATGALDERGRGGDNDADVIPFGRDVDPLFAADDGEFNESDHPRAPDGKFGKGGGGGGGKAAHAPQYGVQHGLFTASHGGSYKPSAPKVAPNISSTPLDPKALKRVGAQMGSNPGGVFEDADGRKFYVKKPESKAHVRNELTAAALYGLAGSPTLRYKPVAGGEHVATEMQKLDKDRASKLTPEERDEARREFAVHAWLGNYDAVGTGGDNLGTVGGLPTALDLGGALEYRAQGKPKGPSFGDKVTEMQTMRDPKIAPDATKVFGGMTPAQLRESARFVTSIPDKAIRETVEKMGGDAALADKLIKRRDDIAAQARTFGAEGAPDKATSTVVFASGQPLPAKELNGVAFTPYEPPDDWAAVSGQNDAIEEPELPDLKGKTLSTGLIIREPDGRTWLARPTNGYDDTEHTFPKGGMEKGLSPQANAIKEAYEETGLKGRITGYAGDHPGTTTMTRLYYAEREAGDPSAAGWESDGVVLAPPDKLAGFLNRDRDKRVASQLGGDADFNEADHPRKSDGKFGTGGSGEHAKPTAKEAGAAKQTAAGKTILDRVSPEFWRHVRFGASGPRLPDRVYRGAEPGNEQQSGMSDGQGVYVSADPHTAAQWGPIKEYGVGKQPRLVDLGDYKNPLARAFVAAMEGVSPKTLTQENFDEIAGQTFVQNSGIELLKKLKVDGYRLGADAFVLGKLDDYAKEAPTAGATAPEKPKVPFPVSSRPHDYGVSVVGEQIKRGLKPTVKSGIPEAKLRATQEHLNAPGEKNEGGAVVEGYGDKPALLRRPNGLYEVIDGHHRIATSLKAGDGVPEAYVWEESNTAQPQRRSLAKQYGGDAALDAEFNESDHPRGKGGKFAKTAGGGEGEQSPDPLSPEALKEKYGENIFSGGETPAKFKSKKEHAAHLLTEGTTSAAMLKALGWPSISMPAMAKSLGMKLHKSVLDGVTYYKGTPMTQAEIAAAKVAVAQAKKEKAAFAPDPTYAATKPLSDVEKYAPKFAAALKNIEPGTAITTGTMKMKAAVLNEASALAAGQVLTDAEAVALIKAYGSIDAAYETAEKAYKPSAAKVTPKHPPATAAELEKAKKTVPLQLQYVPGAPKTAKAQEIVDEFNKKYADKPAKTQAELEQKVADFKDLKAKTDVLAAMEQGKTAAQAQAETAAKQKAEAEAAAKAAALKKAQAEEAAKKNKEIMRSLGISEAEATGFNALVQMIGGSQADAVKSFKHYEEKAKSYGYPVTGFQAALIGNYTDGGYTAINEALRVGSWTEAQHVYVKMVNKALQAMPTYKGTVKRGTSLTKETQGLYKVGHIVEERAFTSTSVTKPWSGNTKFTVTAIGKRGAHVKKLSSHPGEDEVVFSARTFFRVTKVEGQPGGQMHVHMEEVED